MLLRIILSKMLVTGDASVHNEGDPTGSSAGVEGNDCQSNKSVSPCVLDDSMPDKQPSTEVSQPDIETSSHAASLLPKIVRFADLSRCGDEIWIEHQGQLYRLRETRQGKLILTK